MNSLLGRYYAQYTVLYDLCLTHYAFRDFAEALRVTAKAKCAFPSDEEDLYNRGKRLVISSVECGVTAMRAHVEVDEIVGMSCLDVGLKLREEFKEVCEVQIAGTTYSCERKHNPF